MTVNVAPHTRQIAISAPVAAPALEAIGVETAARKTVIAAEGGLRH